jgi:hypothetical protein
MALMWIYSTTRICISYFKRLWNNVSVLQDLSDNGNGINTSLRLHIEKTLTMVNVGKSVDPNIELIINTRTGRTDHEPSPDEFRQLANSIMEEFPEEDDESVSDSEVAVSEGPTFTYPTRDGTSGVVADEPWKPLLNLVSANTTRVLELLDSIGVNPDVNSVIDFYYSEFEPSSDRHSDWSCIDAFNTLLSDERFASVCLHDELRSAQ